MSPTGYAEKRMAHVKGVDSTVALALALSRDL